MPACGFPLGIDLVDHDPVFVLLGQLFKNGRHHAAGAAPRGIEIHDCRFVPQIRRRGRASIRQIVNLFLELFQCQLLYHRFLRFGLLVPIRTAGRCDRKHQTDQHRYCFFHFHSIILSVICSGHREG